MSRLLLRVSVFAVATEGQDLIEYGLLACLIAVAAFFAVSKVGEVVNTVFWQAFPSAI